MDSLHYGNGYRATGRLAGGDSSSLYLSSSHSSPYSGSSSFDSSINRGMASTSSLQRPLPVGPSHHSYMDYSPVGSRYGSSSKPPLVPSYSSSSYSSGSLRSRPYYGSTYSTSVNERTYGSYRRSASSDRYGSSAASFSYYHPGETRRWGENDDTALRYALPGAVNSLTNKYERLSTSERDRAAPTDITRDSVASSMASRRPYMRRRGSSEDSFEGEGRDGLSALPQASTRTAAAGRLYRSSGGATSLPDVPSCAADRRDDDRLFSRNEAVRSSTGSNGSSTKSSLSSGSSEGSSDRPARNVRFSDDGDPSTLIVNGKSVRSPVTEHTPQPNSRSGLIGLQNIGNTCFMNSVLQCLSQTKPLREYCLKCNWQSDVNTNTSRMKGALIKAFAELMNQLWNPSRATYITPDLFKSQIQKFAPRFVGYSQQDAQEFLRYVLQGLHDDVNRVKGKVSPPPPQNDTLADREKAADSWKRYLRIDDSKIVDLFVGQLKSELRCTTCGFASTTFDPFWDLSLPVAPSRLSDVSLYDCLEAFTREEVLDGDEKPKCEKCKTHRKCTKKFSIYRFPKILVLHLKRFSGERYRSRLSTLVEFPIQNLDMRKFASPQSTCSPQYSLYAVSNHSGTPMMGHYTAYAQHAVSAKWYLFDDTRVNQVQENRVVGSEAYVLFYELKT